jgi:spermidine synthase
LRELVELYRAAGWWDRGDTPRLVAGLAAGSHCFLVARAGGRAVAMARAIGDKKSDAYLQDVFVLPAYRGRGLGASLVRRLARRLRGEGFGWIGLIAAPGARPFYERLGFKRLAGHAPMRLGAG